MGGESERLAAPLAHRQLLVVRRLRENQVIHAFTELVRFLARFREIRCTETRYNLVDEFENREITLNRRYFDVEDTKRARYQLQLALVIHVEASVRRSLDFRVLLLGQRKQCKTFSLVSNRFF